MHKTARCCLSELEGYLPHLFLHQFRPGAGGAEGGHLCPEFAAGLIMEEQSSEEQWLQGLLVPYEKGVEPARWDRAYVAEQIEGGVRHKIVTYLHHQPPAR